MYIELFFFSMTETDLRITTKLTQYRFGRSSGEFQINLVIKPDKKIKIILCFSSKNYGFVFQEREIFENLLEEDLLPDGWYLVLQYDLIEVEMPYFKHNNITEFVLIR